VLPPRQSIFDVAQLAVLGVHPVLLASLHIEEVGERSSVVHDFHLQTISYAEMRIYSEWTIAKVLF